MSSRHFAPISQGHLRVKILDQYGDDDGDERFICYRTILDGLGKDIKVSFDLENTRVGEEGEGDITGFRTLPNGLTYYGIISGGDWEHPVFWMVYWDGKRLRGYVPTEGNPWNTTTKQAYGNDDGADLKNARKRYPGRFEDADHEVDQGDFAFDFAAIVKDIEERFQPLPKRRR